MWRVIRRLYLGDRFDAQNRFLLNDCRITHILNCAFEVPCSYPRGYIYLHLELNDPDPAFLDHIPEMCAFIDEGRKQGAVLVHCSKGLSRSPAAILAYLLHRGKNYRQAMRILRRAVGEEDDFIEPGEVFLEQIRDFYEESEDSSE